MFRRARAGFAQHADAVRFIHKRARAVRLRQRDDAAQVGHVAFHAEHAFGHDKDAFIRRAVFQAPLEVVQIVMPEPHHARG